MRSRCRIRVACSAVLWLLLWAVAAAAAPSWEQLRDYYAYDAATPPEASIVATEDSGAFTVESINLKSVNAETVPTTLCRPKGVEKPPVLLVLHGYGGDGKGFATPIAAVVCPKGIAVLAIDAQYHGGRKVEGKDFFSTDLTVTTGAFRQTVMDNRRALDYAATRPDLDAANCVLVGASMGGMLGAVVGAVEPRLKSVFLVVGGGDLVALFQQSKHPAAERVRDAIAAAGAADQVRDAIAYIEPVNFVGHISPRPLQMLNGHDDTIIPRACSEALFAAAQEPKRIAWYDGTFQGGHIPPLGILFTELKGFLQAAKIGKWD